MMTIPVQLSRKDTFLHTYRENLLFCVRQYPDEYCYPESEIPAVYNRMVQAIERGTFNKDGRAFKLTCKALGIKHTYQAIAAYFLRQD